MRLRKALLAILYLVGAVAVLFVYYQDRDSFENPLVVLSYFYLFWIGVAFMLAAALVRLTLNGSQATESEDLGESRKRTRKAKRFRGMSPNVRG